MRITIIEDNVDLSKAISQRLSDIGHIVYVINTGKDAVDFVSEENTDLLILDLNLPYKNGFEILEEIRAKNISIAVLILTARSSLKDRIKGLDIGADDYLIKPFDMEELEARIRVLLRRHSAQFIATDIIGDITYDFGARVLKTSDGVLDIPRRELMLFECFISHKGQLLNKAIIAEYIFGYESEADEKSVETYISRLRKRITPFNVTIKVARGLGYMMVKTN